MEEKEYTDTLKALLAVSKQQWLLVLEFDKRFQTIYEHRKLLRNLNVQLQRIRETVAKNESATSLHETAFQYCLDLRKILTRFKTLIVDLDKEAQKEAQIAADETRTLTNLKRNMLLGISTLKTESMRTSAFKFILDEANARLANEQEFEKIVEQIKQVIHVMAQLQQTERDHIEAEITLLNNIENKLGHPISTSELDSWIFNLEKVAEDIELTMREERQRVVLPLQRILGERQLSEVLAKKQIEDVLHKDAKHKINSDLVARDIAQFVDASEFQRYHDLILKFARQNPSLVDESAIRMLEHGEAPAAKSAMSRFFNLEMFRNLAMTDRLTKAYSRHYGDRESARALNEAKRYNLKLTLIIFDVDKFKAFNDLYGHKIGDLVLQHVASVAKASLKRKEDSLIRWGGEEFAILMPGSNKEAGLRMAEEILSEVAFKSVGLMREINKTASKIAPALRRNSITISMGLSTYPDDFKDVADYEQNFDKLFKITDAFVYAAKNAGRNCIASREGIIKGPSPELIGSNL